MVPLISADPRLVDLLERGRRSLFGYLGPYLLHETNNVLTVLSGIRQLMRLSRELPEKVGPMIDGQLAKVEKLMDGLRCLQPDRDPASLGRVVAGMEELLRLAGKGRKLRIRTEVADAAIPARLVEPLLLGVLCTLLPLLPAEMSAAADVELRAAQPGDPLQVSLSPARQDPATTEEVRWGQEILQRAGLEAELSGRPGTRCSLRVGLGG